MKNKLFTLKIIKYIGLSLLAFLILLGIMLPLTGLMTGAQSLGKDGVSITDWRFTWSTDQTALDGNIDQWNIANAQKPAVKQFGAQYIRLQTTLPAHTNEKALQVVTAGNPLKVLLGGKETYNLGYGSQSYTGSRTSLVMLPASEEEQQLDLFLHVPLSFDLNVTMIDPANAVTAASLPSVIGIAAGIGVILTALLVILLMGLFSVKGYNLNAAVWLGGILLFTGVGLVLSQGSYFVSGFTSPWLYKVQVLSLLAACAGLSFISIHICSGWRRSEQIAVWVQMVFAVVFMILPDPLSVWLCMLAPLILLGAMLLITLRLSDFVQRGKKHAPVITFAYLTGSFCLLFDFLNQLIGWAPPVHELSYAGILLYCFVAFYVLIKQSIGLNIRTAEREKQIELDSRWVQRTISSCAGVFTQQEDIGFCRETANAVKDLVLFDRLCREEYAAGTNNDLTICIALVQEGSYSEIYAENKLEECRYEKILAHAREKENEPLLFGACCLDMILNYRGEPFCIIHTEGITGGISLNFKNVMRIAHTNFESALNSMKLNKGMNDTQLNVFLNLAELAEYRSHNTGEHLKIVTDFVAILCEELGIGEKERNIISKAAMMHDIGKLAVPEAIIDKRGKLTEEEFEQVKKHVDYGCNILSKSPGVFMEAAAVIAKEHHERYDGTGYAGIKGDDIHLYARITMVADVFDALLTRRSYKPAWPEKEAVAHINAQSGKHFDPKIIEAFNRCKDKMLAVKHKYDEPTAELKGR